MTKFLHGLMMLTVYHEISTFKDFGEYGFRVKVNVVHRIARRLMIFCTTYLFPNILIKGTAIDDIQKLHPIADTENGQFHALRDPVKPHIKSDSAAIHRLDLMPAPFAIERWRDVRTANNEKTVDQANDLHDISEIVINWQHERNSTTP